MGTRQIMFITSWNQEDKNGIIYKFNKYSITHSLMTYNQQRPQKSILRYASIGRLQNKSVNQLIQLTYLIKLLTYRLAHGKSMCIDLLQLILYNY